MPGITDIEAFQKEFEYETINAAPAYTLAGCIAAAGRHEEEPGDDVEDSTDPIEEIKERFRKAVYLCDDEQLEFLRFAAELTDKKAPLGEAIGHQPFGVFYWNDFAYLFLWEDAYYLVMPEELATVYREVTAEETFAAVNARNRELTVYAAGLLQLYGAYEISWFVTVWNHHHKEKLTAEEAIGFLSDRAYFRSDFYFIADWIVHDCLDEDEFDELFDEIEDLPYYMPPKSVIRALSTRGYDDFKSPCEREMDSFLAEYIKDERTLDDVQMDISLSVKRLESPAEIRDVLAGADAPTDDEAFRAEFERLYNKLREETNIWELKGHTPYQFKDATGEELQRFKLPKVKSRKKK